MAIIKPFKGIRPPQDLVEQVASRPYDVLNSAEAREEAKGNEKSLYHIIKPEIDFPVGTDEHDECVYQKAAENFQMFQDKGWLVQDDKENYYVYAQTMNGKTQYGLVVGAYVPDYMNGVIKKHELTRRDKEEDRMKHVRVNNANIEPVFFAYPDNATLDAIIAHYTAEKPVYDFIAPGDGFGHTFWIIDKQEDIDAITKEFAKMPALYIADGHRLHNFSLYLDGKWYSLTAKPGTYNDNDPIGVLDVTISSNLILDEVLGIKDLRSDKRIDFVGGIRGLGELKKRVDSGEMKVALALYPVSMKQLMDIADTGNIMPPKTTWFEPKLRSGLVIHKLD